MRLEKCLSERTIEGHVLNADIYLKSGSSVRDFLQEIKQTKSLQTYKNYLATLKVLFRDFLKQPDVVQDFKFPRLTIKPKILPSKEQIKTFYNAMPDKYKVIFLALASSGLRVSELLSAEIDAKNHMLIPKPHNGSTKHSWISFYNEETSCLLENELPRIEVDGLNHVFKKVTIKTGIRIYPHLLRSVFAREMSKAGVQDRYIDAFCGRVPGSVLARHYTEYSPEALKEVYEKANLRILI